MFNKLTSKNIRILVGKPGLDGHDRGALILCKALMKSGMEVIYSGLKITPNNIVKMAIEEDVDAIALSLLNGAHMTIFTKISQMLKEKNIKNIAIIGGGIIPDEDKQKLERNGVTGNFGPGTKLDVIIKHIESEVYKKRGKE